VRGGLEELYPTYQDMLDVAQGLRIRVQAGDRWGDSLAYEEREELYGQGVAIWGTGEM
jgi:hypothetical protein